MQTKLLLRSLILSICCLIGSPTLFAQVTTAALSGTVLDQAGEGLIGATVLARHEPSGTQYGVQTRDGGLFTIPNMRVGGPYTVKVSYVGMKEQQISGVSLNLNTRANLSFKMEDASTILALYSSPPSATTSLGATGQVLKPISVTKSFRRYRVSAVAKPIIRA